MPSFDTVVKTTVPDTFRVAAAAGMFDFNPHDGREEHFTGTVPGLKEDWTIGLVVGPSGSGKTTIAKKIWGRAVMSTPRWPSRKSILDGFPESLEMKDITSLLLAVGLSSIPVWFKPYRVLSNGERFRADLAYALASGKPLIVCDEYTSVVDRTVARIASLALAKSLRKKRIPTRFVAVTCHYDVSSWLNPDWVLDMADGSLTRRRLRWPKIKLEIAPVDRTAWVLFRRHHYLSGSLHRAARCFGCFLGDEAVGFSAWLREGRDDAREHRTVIRPDFQGVGIGNRFSDFCASVWKGLGYVARSTTSHPSMIYHRSRSTNWYRGRLTMAPPEGRTGTAGRKRSSGRLTGGFMYTGPGMASEQAESYIEATPRWFQVPVLADQLLIEIERFPGSTCARLARVLGSSTSKVRQTLDRCGDGLSYSKRIGQRCRSICVRKGRTMIPDAAKLVMEHILTLFWPDGVLSEKTLDETLAKIRKLILDFHQSKGESGEMA